MPVFRLRTTGNLDRAIMPCNYFAWLLVAIFKNQLVYFLMMHRFLFESEKKMKKLFCSYLPHVHTQHSQYFFSWSKHCYQIVYAFQNSLFICKHTYPHAYMYVWVFLHAECVCFHSVYFDSWCHFRNTSVKVSFFTQQHSIS